MNIDAEYQKLVDRLQTALQGYPLSMSFNEINGYLTAVAVAAEHIEEAPWRQKLLGMSELTDIDSIDADVVKALDDVVAYIDELLMEQVYELLVSSETIQGVELPKSNEWANGFLTCVSLITDTWDIIVASSGSASIRQVLMLNIIANPEKHASLLFNDDVDYGSVEFLKDIRNLAVPIAEDLYRQVLGFRHDVEELSDEIYSVMGSQTLEDPEALSDEELFGLLLTQHDAVSMRTIQECVNRQESMLPELCAYLRDEENWQSDDDGRWWALLHCVFILGKMTGAQAADALIDVIERQEKDPYADIWDWLDGYWPALLANKMEYAKQRLIKIARAEPLSDVDRYSALDCLLCYACEQAPEQLETTVDLVAEVVQSLPSKNDSRYLCAYFLLQFPRDRHRKLLSRLAYEDRKNNGINIRDSDITESFATGDDPHWVRFADPWGFYSAAEIAKRQLRWREQDEQEADEFFSDDGEEDDFPLDDFGDDIRHSTFALPATHMRETPKIGRNDPCPCGSGKKYKKCCLH